MTRLTSYASRFTHHVSRFTQHDLFPVVCVMLLARVLALIALRPGGYIAETSPDGAYYFDWGRLAAGGAYPLIDYWTEYPPVFPWLSVLAYRIAVLLPGWLDQRFWFHFTLHAFILPFDIANVILIYELARRVRDHTAAVRSAWLYATLFVPLFVFLGWFESLALCTVLFALWAILDRRSILAGVAIGCGALVKPYAALVGVVSLIHLRPLKKIVLLSVAAAVTLALGLLPFLIASPPMLKASLDSMLARPAWSSIYAVIDGVYQHVPFQLANRFDPALATATRLPTHIPWGMVTIAFGAVYVVTLIRARRRTTPRAAVALAGFTFACFLLWSKGYSVQWSLYLMAFVCILLPDRIGVLLLLSLEALCVLEWPVAFILLEGSPGFLTALIFIRTAFMIGLTILFGALLFTEPASRRSDIVERWAKLGSSVALSAIGLLALSVLPVYAAQRYQVEPMRAAINLIQSTSAPERANVLFDDVATYERLTSYLPGWSTLAVLPYGNAIEQWSVANVQRFGVERPELWYVLDFGAEQKKDQRQTIDRRLSESLCKVSREFAGSAQVSHFVNAPPDRDLNTTAAFKNGLQLDRARISNTDLKPGDPICLELQWSTQAQLPTDYTVFLHVLDPNGQLVAQSDLQPGGGDAPTSGWPIGQPITDRHGVVLPPTLSPGTYQIVIGLYGPDGARLTSSAGADSITLSTFSIR